MISSTADQFNTLLIGLNLSNSNKQKWPADDSLAELAKLADTAGLNVCAKCIQKREKPHPKFYLGSGKLAEVTSLCEQYSIKVVLADDELSPLQIKTLEEEFKVKILDRTGIILDIFANHARSSESQLQVELAQLEYQLPRLTRLWLHLSRLGGGIGTRGPGEKQLESDKRQVRNRILAVKKKLKKISNQRELRREKRKNVPLITCSLVGYTNAGKSTLMNQLTQAGVLVEDKLFATLTSTTRKLRLSQKQEILLSDTVGFIQKLPHQLVSSFRSTLEEAMESDILLHIVDISHPNYLEMIQTVNNLLVELHPEKIPQVYIFNKIDAISDISYIQHDLNDFQPQVHISAKNNLNINLLLQTIETIILESSKTFSFTIPYARMDIVNLIHQNGKVLEIDYKDVIHIKAEINAIIGEKIMGKLYQ
ncbi:GTPase HflX [Candidatus Margulisiibacteriota bacterium]